MRKAIDATLSAYKTILEPKYSEKYINRDKYFQFIKSNMQKEIKKNSSKYPLAHELIKITYLDEKPREHWIMGIMVR